MEKIGVIGAGSWGTTLANHLAALGFEVRIWARESEVVDSINSEHINKLFLPGKELCESLVATSGLEKAIEGATLLLSSVPSHGIRGVLEKAGKAIDPATIIVNTSKGIEEGTHQTGSAVFGEFGFKNVVVLSGPTFAREVSRGLPCALSAASSDKENAKRVQAAFSSPVFRVYTNSDVIGVELGGSLKNVMAIAAGISDGLELGTNARAALITRGLKEMARLGVAMGAKPETFSGLSGIGDLVLTCTGDLSRNRSVGLKLASGARLKQIVEEMHMVAEGVKTTSAVYALARELKVDMPITEEIHRVLYEDKDPGEAVMDLMARDLKNE